MFFIFPEKSIEKTLQLFVSNSKRLGGYIQWMHFFCKKCTPLGGSYKNTSGFLFENYPDHPCFYPEEPGGTRRFPSSTINCSEASQYRAYRVLYHDDFYQGPISGPRSRLKNTVQDGVDFKL
jgi:hypothetical protein